MSYSHRPNSLEQKVVVCFTLVVPHASWQIEQRLNGVRQRNPFRRVSDDEASEDEGEYAEEEG